MGFLTKPRWSCACVGVAALWILCVVWMDPAPRVAAQDDRVLLVVVSSATGGEDIALSTLRQAFGGYTTTYSGKRLIPFNQPIGTPSRELFDGIVLGLSPDQIGPYWVDRKVRQGTDAPRTLPSAEMVLRVVASLRGAIGYVEMSPTAVPPVLNALRIDGIRPTDRRYVFHSGPPRD